MDASTSPVTSRRTMRSGTIALASSPMNPDRAGLSAGIAPFKPVSPKMARVGSSRSTNTIGFDLDDEAPPPKPPKPQKAEDSGVGSSGPSGASSRLTLNSTSGSAFVNPVGLSGSVSSVESTSVLSEKQDIAPFSPIGSRFPPGIDGGSVPSPTADGPPASVPPALPKKQRKSAANISVDKVRFCTRDLLVNAH